MSIFGMEIQRTGYGLIECLYPNYSGILQCCYMRRLFDEHRHHALWSSKVLGLLTLSTYNKVARILAEHGRLEY